MSFLLVTTFMLSWAPLQFLNLCRFFSKSLNGSMYFAEIFFVCHLFAVSSSYLNPLIYTITNSKCKKGFEYVFKSKRNANNEFEIHRVNNLSRMSTLKNKYTSYA